MEHFCFALVNNCFHKKPGAFVRPCLCYVVNCGHFALVAVMIHLAYLFFIISIITTADYSDL